MREKYEHMTEGRLAQRLGLGMACCCFCITYVVHVSYVWHLGFAKTEIWDGSRCVKAGGEKIYALVPMSLNAERHGEACLLISGEQAFDRSVELVADLIAVDAHLRVLAGEHAC